MQNLLIAAAVALMPSPHADGLATTRVVLGQCVQESHVAEGPAEADLSGRQSRFFCDSVAISTSRPSDGRVTLQFAETGGQIPLLIAFSGAFTEQGTVVEVDTVYIGDRKFTPNDGFCLLTYSEARLAGITCGARIDVDGRRIVPVVGFEAEPD